MARNDMINIVMCFDDGYVLPSKIALYSLFRNNPTHHICVYVVHAGLSSKSQNELVRLVAFFDRKEIIFKKIDDSRIRERFAGTLVQDYISIATYYRYVIADVLPRIDKVLFMDGDVLFNGDVVPVWNMDIRGYMYATVKDNWMMRTQTDHMLEIGLGVRDDYFIAGFLLMDLSKIRKDNVIERLFSTTVSDEYRGKLTYQDQDVLNIVCRGKIKAMPAKYHFVGYDFYHNEQTFEGVISAHYSGPIKPWDNAEENSKSDIYFLQLYGEYVRGLERLVAGECGFEWRELYEENVRNRVYIQRLLYDSGQKDAELNSLLGIRKSARRLVGNIKRVLTDRTGMERERAEYHKRLARRMKNVGVSIISRNCIGGVFYHDLGLRFNSPTINLWMTPADFSLYVNNLREFTEDGRMVRLREADKDYPVGALSCAAGVIKIYFQHYKTYSEAKTKWFERARRIDLSNVIVIDEWAGDDGAEGLADFDKIMYPKIIFGGFPTDRSKGYYHVGIYDEGYYPGKIMGYRGDDSVRRWYDERAIVNIARKMV